MSGLVEGQEVEFNGTSCRVLKIDAEEKNCRIQAGDCPPVWCKVWELSGSQADSDLQTVQIHFRSKDSADVEAWHALLGEESVALVGLSTKEKELVRTAFAIQHRDIFDECDSSGGSCAVVSPANSFGDMTGGIDFVYLKRFGHGLQVQLQERIRRERAGELPVGDALILKTGEDPIRYCISAPTMRVPLDIRGTCNAYLAFRAVLVAVRKHNFTACGTDRISDILCPGLGTGIGLLPAQTCAYQMLQAFRQQVLGRHGCFQSATLDHGELVKLR